MNNVIEISAMPKRVPIFNFFMYVFPLLTFWIAAFSFGFFTQQELQSMITHPLTIFAMILLLLPPLIIYQIIKNMIMSYDSTEASLAKANLAVKLYPKLSILLTISSVFIFTGLMSYICKQNNIHYPHVIFIINNLGLVLLFSLLSYVLFFQKFEEWLSFLPFGQKDISF